MVLVGEVVALALVGVQVDAVHVLVDVDGDVVPIDLVLWTDGLDAQCSYIVNPLRFQQAQGFLDIVHGIKALIVQEDGLSVLREVLKVLYCQRVFAEGGGLFLGHSVFHFFCKYRL